VKSPHGQPSLDARPRESELQQLVLRDDPMLSARKRSE
jgi:hypothetical protein